MGWSVQAGGRGGGARGVHRVHRGEWGLHEQVSIILLLNPRAIAQVISRKVLQCNSALLLSSELSPDQ